LWHLTANNNFGSAHAIHLALGVRFEGMKDSALRAAILAVSRHAISLKARLGRGSVLRRAPD